MKSILFLLLFTFQTIAGVDVLFHPYDPTLKKISKELKKAKTSIDMALYNVDSKKNNPIIAMLSTPSMQKRISSGQLQVRLIFEGYETPQKNKNKMHELEKIGIDVRHLKSSKKMHHKFAIIDGATNNPYLITGSANWSMWSFRNFNENILFVDRELELSSAFQREFNLLWKMSHEFGNETSTQAIKPLGKGQGDIEVTFNTDNYDLSKGKFTKSGKGFVLTRKIVKAIDSAKNQIEIATTRLRLRPIYDALVRAAARGVQIKVLVTMGEYEYRSKRRKMKVQKCVDAYYKKCSTSKNFAVFLARKDFSGHKNIDVRMKYFHVKKSVYLNKQMHSKYMIVDDKSVLSGSFNWSYSAEYNHIENLVTLFNKHNPVAVNQFKFDFKRLWDLNRDKYQPLKNSYMSLLANSQKVNCSFPAMSLSYTEIDSLLRVGRKFRKSLARSCK